MTVLDRSELEASPLADLHLIADQLGMESFRRLRKADLIDAIMAEQGGESQDATEERGEGGARPRRPRGRVRRGRGGDPDRQDEAEAPADEVAPDDVDSPANDAPSSRRPARRGRSASQDREERSRGSSRDREERGRGSSQDREGRGRGSSQDREERGRSATGERTVEGVVEVVGNGSAFLRVNPPEPSDDDVYISAAQVRRCELVSGDEVQGPVRKPRRSERYPSLVRVETINGQPADTVAEGPRYDELPAAWPSERIAFDSEDPTLKAIEWLTPIGQGSRALIVGASRAGKTEALRRIATALAGKGATEPMLVLAGARPEELSEWREGPLTPLVALSFAASADAQGHAVEASIETAKRLAARGENPIVLIDGLDGLHPHTARKVLAGARNIPDGGSVTVIATASRPFGGETTVIALDVAHVSAGRFPALDLAASGTLKVELLVGEQGAEEIARARAATGEG
jgi:transcription termination factor Rho